MTSLTKWVLQRRAATILISLIVILFGVFSVTQLKSELLPSIDFPYITISTIYPGASSDDVTNQVSLPVENAVAQLPRLKSIRSTSQESFSLVFAEFEFGTDMKNVEQQLNSKLRNVSLPNGLSGTPVQPTVSNFSFGSQPIIWVTVEGKQGQSSLELGKWAREVAKPAFSKLPDVGNVEVVGDSVQMLTISFRPQDLATRGLTINDVSNVLKGANLSFPAGTTDIAGQSVPVRTAFTFSSPDDISNLIIVPTSGGGFGGAAQTQLTRLKDIADVKVVESNVSGISRANGKPGVLVQVFKTQTGNTVTVSDGVLKKNQELNNQYSNDLNVDVIYDQALQVRKSVEGLLKEGGLGALFAVLVIFIFLRNVRSTLVTAISIPTSVVVAFILLWTQNITLNIMTLGGLAIAVGRVVDDAIVVLENIYRHVQNGEPVVIAVRKGTREVAGAITSSTITTVAVFLPLGFVGGITGQFFLPFALTVSFALMASLLVSITIVPVFASFFITHKSVGKERHDTLLQRTYTPGLKWSLKHRWLTLLLCFILFVGSIASVGIFKIPFAFLPESGDKLLNVVVNTAPGTDTATVVAVTDKVEKVLDEYKQQGTVTLYQTTIAGDTSFSRSQRAFGGNVGSANILVRLESSAKTNDVATEMREKMKPIFPPGGSVSVAPQGGFSSNSLSLVVQGPNPQAVRDATRQIVNELSTVDKLANVKSDVTNGTPQIVVTPDPTKSPLANTALIGSQLRNLLQGQSAGTIKFSNGQQLDAILLLPPPGAGNLDEYINSLKQISIAGAVKLGDVAKVERVDGANSTTRINQSLAGTVSADITVEDTGGVTRVALDKVKALALPAGVTYSLSGAGQQQQEAFIGLGVAMLAAIALVYIVMVITFGSLIAPLAILFSLPLALIGALGALVITQRALGLPALIGMLMLIGIVVTNAIVLVDLYNQLIKEGYKRYDALVQAGRTRVRPIIMTAIATIFALTPLALGFSEGSIIAAELGTVVIGGLFSSTFLTLVVVPVVLSLFEDWKEWFGNKFNQGSGKNVLDTIPVEKPEEVAA
ncbi:MAG: efflux RND transporter permease subunit [Chloroflexi bacterium]|uniref:Efflux RND transporter permease subunit n=1 Tax=Candidatus Chlorohelix allophototropha TaxID=3003348 RepID=A0A8T7M5E5_9CHLR|nr:efflux RND transporter permease subunit [Chloroflexota bacterium]WJW69233.1 efflux RND transporter permease subunit [Chloroflexota bacterium L227-S17]